jgi:hypothetical protein
MIDLLKQCKTFQPNDIIHVIILQCDVYCMFNAILLLHMYDVIKQNLIYIYINKDGFVNTQKENQDNQNNSNEVEDVMLKMHLLP